MRPIRLTLLGLTLAGTVAAPAQAQTSDPFSCRASAARVTQDNLPLTVEPVRANAAGNPCSSQSAATVERTTIGPLTVDAVGAFTNFVAGSSAAAFAGASQPKVELGGLVVEADGVLASATATCEGTNPVLAGSSRVAGLRINGQGITLPPGDAPFEIPLGPLGRVAVNQEATDAAAGTLTRQAVVVETPLTTVVLGEAIAGATAAGCTAGTGTGAVPPVCVPGSTYDQARNVCVIRERGGDGSGGSGGSGEVVVGRPFEAPQGGRVISLTEARTRFKSPCLRGKGVDYVVLGTKGRDQITGTNDDDRILLLGGDDRAEGGRGDDCFDGGKGVDTMSGALDDDRIYGRTGGDHLIGGSHDDRLAAGPGKDTINAGYGKDRIKAGKGADRINIATAGVPARSIRCGKGFDKVRVNRNEKRRARARKARCERVYTIR